MFCSKCGTELLTDAVFCHKCGSSPREPVAEQVHLSYEQHVVCPECHGQREFRVDCYSCHGPGRVRCDYCWGAGKIQSPTIPGRDDVCHRCGGSGTLPCDSCAGRGFDWSTCGTCEGFGQVTRAKLKEIEEAEERRAKLEAERTRDEAEAQKRRAEEQARQNAERDKQIRNHVHAAGLQLSSGNYSDALTVSNAALELQPKERAAWVVKVQALAAMGRLEEALDCCSQGLAECCADGELTKLKAEISGVVSPIMGTLEQDCRAAKQQMLNDERALNTVRDKLKTTRAANESKASYILSKSVWTYAPSGLTTFLLMGVVGSPIAFVYLLCFGLFQELGVSVGVLTFGFLVIIPLIDWIATKLLGGAFLRWRESERVRSITNVVQADVEALSKKFTASSTLASDAQDALTKARNRLNDARLLPKNER